MRALFGLAFVVFVSAVPTSRVPASRYPGMTAAFNAWASEHNRVYSSAEEQQRRFEIFTQNAVMIEEHNSKNLTWFMTLNQFADLTSEEFVALQKLRPGNLGTEFTSAPVRHQISTDPSNVPTSVDWRTQGYVTDIKNQGSCGSCWAFSTVVSLEGQSAKAFGKLTSYSEQDLVDCVKNQALPGESEVCCDGCQGGLMDSAFAYMIAKQDGLDDTEDAYPYKGKDGSCAFQAGTAGPATVKSYTDIAQGDEKSLEDAVATVGPVSVAVDANMFWQFYGGGVFKPFWCDKNALNHGVAAVGYGVSGSDQYWIIKNSWGTTWGEKGYMRLSKGSNVCGVANAAVYPVV